MDTLVQVVTTAFWGLLLLSALVFLHEGGHFLAARACGVRVTEYFLGLPCRFNLSYTSKRIGTKFGITPILLGGYAMICGMDPTSSLWLPPCLRLCIVVVLRRLTTSPRNSIAPKTRRSRHACSSLNGVLSRLHATPHQKTRISMTRIPRPSPQFHATRRVRRYLMDGVSTALMPRARESLAAPDGRGRLL